MDCSPPGSSVCEILQARILEWVAIPFSRKSSWPMDWTQVFCIARGIFTVSAAREALLSLVCVCVCVCVWVTQSCLMLCDPMYYIFNVKSRNGLTAHFFLALHKSPLFSCITIYSSIHLLKDILVAFKFQITAVVNKTAVIIHVQVFVWP